MVNLLLTSHFFFWAGQIHHDHPIRCKEPPELFVEHLVFDRPVAEGVGRTWTDLDWG